MSHDRLHDYLDGELPREALDDAERQMADALHAAVREAADALRSAPAPDLVARVMAALPGAEEDAQGASSSAPTAAPAATATAAVRPGLLAQIGAWLWGPVTVTLRPAYAFAGVAAALAGVLLVGRLPSPGGSPLPPVAMSEEGDERMYVQFRIEVPEASEVAVAGTFTDWRPEYELTEVSPGIWTGMVPLPPGVHDYAFVIDGERMVVDPYAPRVPDSFGGSNSRLFLPSPDGHA